MDMQKEEEIIAKIAKVQSELVQLASHAYKEQADKVLLLKDLRITLCILRLQQQGVCVVRSGEQGDPFEFRRTTHVGTEDASEETKGYWYKLL